AFGAWSTASRGKISFNFVSGAQTADIQCNLTDSSTDLHRAFAAGETRWSLTQTESLQANVYLLTRMNGQQITNSRFYWLCLHEIGHCLGLQHSPHPEDIMFLSMPIKDEWKSPSARDELSLNHLYSGS